MIQSIKKIYQDKPLQVLLFVGLTVRLIAAVFSKGYGMTDDHFKIITEAHLYITGNATKFWSPEVDEFASKRSMLYPYLHYLLFSFLDYFKIYDPQFKMLVVRLLHAFYSLFTVYFSYKITLALSTKEVAKKVGLIAALAWFLPMLSVRNLIEVVSIPLLMAGTYYVILGYKKERTKAIFLLAGVLLGFAFSVRYQTMAFTGGFGLFLLIRKEWKAVLFLSIGILMPVVLNHYVLESLVFGFAPFIKILNYVDFNLSHATEYVTGPWYNFALLFVGLFIPPFSIILLLGVFKVWKKQLILVLPFLLFMVFHSIFPGKQERFVLPAIMFFPILGLIGYEFLKKENSWFKRNPRFFRVSWKVFWVVNFILLIPITLTYSKRSKVEAMYYLNDEIAEDKDVLVFCSGKKSDIVGIPAFYSNIRHYPEAYRISSKGELEVFGEEVRQLKEERLPDYLFLFEQDQKEERMKAFRKIFPDITYKTKIEASFVDQLMHWLNPRNKNYAIEIYKCQK